VQHLLSPWSSFYVTTGTSAASLTGLMFVVITLVTTREQRSRDGVATFSTPTVMHFVGALLVSLVLVAPWHSLFFAALSTGLIGLCGVGYLLRVTYLTKQLTVYTPDTEDWIWYTVLPFVAYGVILSASIALLFLPAKSLFVVAGGVVLLVLIGVRNAWDVVTYLVISDR